MSRHELESGIREMARSLARLDAALHGLSRALARAAESRLSANAGYFGALAAQLSTEVGSIEQLRLAVLETAHVCDHFHPLPPAFVSAQGDGWRVTIVPDQGTPPGR